LTSASPVLGLPMMLAICMAESFSEENSGAEVGANCAG
jgi:hypothetical protein